MCAGDVRLRKSGLLNIPGSPAALIKLEHNVGTDVRCESLLTAENIFVLNASSSSSNSATIRRTAVLWALGTCTVSRASTPTRCEFVCRLEGSQVPGIQPRS